MADATTSPSKGTTNLGSELINATPDDQTPSLTPEPTRETTTTEKKPDPLPSTISPEVPTPEVTKPPQTTQPPTTTKQPDVKPSPDKPEPTKEPTTANPATTPATHAPTTTNGPSPSSKSEVQTTTPVQTTSVSVTSVNTQTTPVTTLPTLLTSSTLAVSSSSSLSLSPTASATPKNNGSSGGVSTSLVGGIVGAVFGTLILGAVAMFFIRRKRRHARSTRASRAMDEIFAPGNKGFGNDHHDNGAGAGDAHWDPPMAADRGYDHAEYANVAAPDAAYQHQQGQYFDDGTYGYNSTPQMAAAGHPTQAYSPQLSNQAFNNMTSPVMNYRDIGSAGMGMTGTTIAMTQLDQHQQPHGQNTYSNEGNPDMAYHDPYAQQYHNNDPHGYQNTYASPHGMHPDDAAVAHQQGEYAYEGRYYEDPYHQQQHYDAGDHAVYAPHDAQQQQGKATPGSPSAAHLQDTQQTYNHQEYDKQMTGAGHAGQPMQGGYYQHEDPNMYQNSYAAADQGYHQQDAYQQPQKSNMAGPAQQEQRHPH
ncbi:hypothetical protein DFQ28_002852 [Apophysomyces sp. BC1034]|nr:hypothetical protein DFQ30_005274 [Apophysomyces sp. BC1015]KAG0179416.1 hypothetical protein DFQ29_002137 [Apophysomyces sp. BC1021]KAG0189841.1 hypothetical protein DFQ28_002852 [Apophysomyces sp. BC1034]